MKTKRLAPVTWILAGLAVVLLLVSAVGGARAALTYYSEIYESPLAMREIGISLYENGTAVANGGALLTGLVKEGESFLPGKKYDENIDVANSGQIDEFIRVAVYKYWIDDSGKKLQDLDPSLITIEMEDGWIHDEAQSTEERDVYYYNTAVSTGGVVDVIKSITCDDSVLKLVTQEDDGKGNVTTTYVYDGKKLGLKVEASGVQTHNAQDSILSAWGANVTISGNSLSLR